jgi:hypothetical protein
VHTEEGRLYLLVAIDRTSKFAVAELHEKVTRRVAGNFLRALAAAVPYKIHTVLTDNGTHFTEPSGNTWTPEEIRAMRAEKVPFRCHSFEGACADLDIEHRLTKPRHPWANGQVERMNRTIKDATVKRFHYDSHDQLRQHLADFVAACNFARRLKTLRGLTPYEAICKAWVDEPSGSLRTRTTKSWDQTSKKPEGLVPLSAATRGAVRAQIRAPLPRRYNAASAGEADPACSARRAVHDRGLGPNWPQARAAPRHHLPAGHGCEQTKIEHRVIRPRCPWTIGQVEPMNRTIKDAAVKQYHYASHDELR